MWWLFSCSKSDPSKDELKTAKEVSRHEKEDRMARLKIEEEEEIEKATQESLKVAEEEDEKRREKSKGKGKIKQVDDHDQVESKGQIKNSNKDHVDENVNPSPSICKGCKKIEDGRFVNAFGALWHPQCLCCLHCQKIFAMDEIPNLTRQFHRPCYEEHCTCYVCKKKFPSTKEGRKYIEHPFWKEKYCPSHDDDKTAKCCSCERLEAFGTKYVMLDDSRWLCRECLECAVMDTNECYDLHLEIREFFEDLNMKVDKEFPLLLVEREALNKAEKEEKICEVVTRGICLSEEQVITSISERPRMGPNNQLIDIVTESHIVARKCEVTAILILYGFPKLLTGYILAHEMMHAYLRLNGYRNLNTVLEEGLCQVLGHMWLEPHKYATPNVVVAATTTKSSSAASSSRTPPPAATTSKKGDKSEFEKKFVEFCIYQIETDDSLVYGLGFKKVHRMMVLNDLNLKYTLKHIVGASKSIQDSKC